MSFSSLPTGAGQPVDHWVVGRSSLRVKLPAELIRRIQQTISQTRRLVDEDLQAHLEASSAEPSVGSSHTRTEALGRPQEARLTPDQLQLAKAVAAQAVKQVVALRVDSLQHVHFGAGSVVQGQSPKAEPVSLPKLMEKSGRSGLGRVGRKSGAYAESEVEDRQKAHRLG